jgi:hypothetical protein
MARFLETAETELLGLHEGNYARYRIRPSQYATWHALWDTPTAPPRQRKPKSGTESAELCTRAKKRARPMIFVSVNTDGTIAPRHHADAPGEKRQIFVPLSVPLQGKFSAGRAGQILNLLIFIMLLVGDDRLELSTR